LKKSEKYIMPTDPTNVIQKPEAADAGMYNSGWLTAPIVTCMPWFVFIIAPLQSKSYLSPFLFKFSITLSVSVSDIPLAEKVTCFTCTFQI
jgi:hypothetical protein